MFVAMLNIKREEIVTLDNETSSTWVPIPANGTFKGLAGIRVDVLVGFLFQPNTLCMYTLDGQNRQSPIASDFRSRTQIAALFAILLYWNV